MLPPANWWQKAKRWQRPASDRRDRRLHRLLVVAYVRRCRTRIADRLGVFITAFRDCYSGRWRLLEATVLP